MKYLSINQDGSACFSLSGKQEDSKVIDKISKDDILALVLLALENQDESIFEMDENTKEIKNPAQRIIYKNIYGRLKELLKKRVSFEDEDTNLYKEAFQKYHQEFDHCRGD